MNPKYPVFIPTKGRWENPQTINALNEVNVPFKIVVEKQELKHYEKIVGSKDIIVLPHSNEGLVVTRNWIWDYAKSLGTEYFWTFDDNINCFYRLNKNKRVRPQSGTFLKVMEDFVARYENIAIAGMQYRAFSAARLKWNPFRLNTRVYSNMLIKTDIPYRNRGFFNDDTDLCLQVLKDGLCTILFYIFQIDKAQTMSKKGGMTPHYQGDGRLKMAQELRKRHPDVVTVVRRWDRWQHLVNYKPLKSNKLILRKDVDITSGIDNYGMKLEKII